MWIIDKDRSNDIILQKIFNILKGKIIEYLLPVIVADIVYMHNLLLHFTIISAKIPYIDQKRQNNVYMLEVNEGMSHC